MGVEEKRWGATEAASPKIVWMPGKEHTGQVVGRLIRHELSECWARSMLSGWLATVPPQTTNKPGWGEASSPETGCVPHRAQTR